MQRRTIRRRSGLSRKKLEYLKPWTRQTGRPPSKTDAASVSKGAFHDRFGETAVYAASALAAEVLFSTALVRVFSWLIASVSLLSASLTFWPLARQES